MDDLISRQALCEYALNQKDKSITPNDIMRFPSAQPEPPTHGSIYAETAEKQGDRTTDGLISRKAAIEALQEHRNLFCDNTPETFSKLSYAEKSRVDELDMAIATLINLPSAQPDSKELSFTHKALDTISRQDAIRIVDGIDTWQAGWRGDAIESMKALPSAQPETHEERTETHACDCISRQAAIEAIENTEWYHLRGGVMVHGANSKEHQAWYKEQDIYKALEQLPSAQPELIRINLNEPIKVKLTDWGKEIYYHQYDRTNQIAGREICKPRFPREDENGYTEFQLWCFIELYGMHMGMTLPNVIEPLEIVYER